jgi:YD repeat-containing protein
VYTDHGEIAVERTLIGGGSYEVSYGYDAAGNVTSLEMASGVTTATAYSSARPKTVTVTAGSDQQVIRNLAFLPFGPQTRGEFRGGPERTWHRGTSRMAVGGLTVRTTATPANAWRSEWTGIMKSGSACRGAEA